MALAEERVVGYAAFTEVRIDDRLAGWFGLGPIGVLPDMQRAGIGSALIADGFHRLKRADARGCVVVGDPAYYSRFGFSHNPGLTLAEFPPDYFLAIAFRGEIPLGNVTYHAALS